MKLKIWCRFLILLVESWKLLQRKTHAILSMENESVDFVAGSNSYEDSYKKKKKQIEVVHKEYEPYSDILEEAIENVEVHEREDENISDDEQVNTVSSMDKYAIFDPDKHDSLKNYDIGPDLPETYTRKSNPTCEKYETEVYCSGVHMNDNEYAEQMRTLSKKQYELCIPVRHQLEEEAEPMHIFIEGGGGVGKTCLVHALMETITWYYRKQVAEN